MLQIFNVIRRHFDHEFALIPFVASYGVFRDRTNSFLGQNALYCMHWLQHSMNDIVNNRLPVKKFFYSEYSDVQRQLAGLIRKFVIFLLEIANCLLPREFYDILEDIIYFVCVLRAIRLFFYCVNLFYVYVHYCTQCTICYLVNK